MVDNDHQLRTALGLMLTRAGYEVGQAASGHEAITMHRHQPFDLVIAEIVMTGKDGFETLTELRRHAEPPQVIAMSRGGRISAELYLRMAEHLGAEYVLAKPFASELLLAAVRHVLGGR